MKKLLATIIYSLLLLSTLAQKINFKNPAFQKGGWVAPAVTLGGGIYFGIKAIQANKKVTTYENHVGESYKQEGSLKAYTIASTVCFTATGFILLSMHSDRNTPPKKFKLNISNDAGIAMSQFACGFFNGWHEAIQAGHWGKGTFWDASISWKNKYKSDMTTARFPGSTTFFVSVTDGYHLTNTLSNATSALTLVVLLNGKGDMNWKKIIKKLLISAVSNRAGFYVAYNGLFK